MINRKLRYLVKWEGYGVKHNSWEPWDNVHAPELIAEFYRKHPGAARQVRAADFTTIPFRSFSPPIVPRRHSLEGGVDVRGHSISRTSGPTLTLAFGASRTSGTSVHSGPSSQPLPSTLVYIPPHRR